ncbi:hypothetical protein Aasi_1318 [Candidatus Amoebophilus asiaticus 5a2]|uniref:F-box domain-containing protein n=1 Tax=Amoebophilus asiaticus (strain 5a2) TaxID=452471 RepID=B3ETS6_AMOA5|nr:hypothetical protein [Candidatus Amoebophilus asiaticus]ACE06628.1 hypothetical protein Aasi_1318 [Candidatus Amoebophilus asiaticus 5a2]
MKPKRNYKLLYKLVSILLMIGVFLESCTGLGNVPNTLQLPSRSRLSGQIITSKRAVSSALSTTEVSKSRIEGTITSFPLSANQEGGQIPLTKDKQVRPTAASATYPTPSTTKKPAENIEKSPRTNTTKGVKIYSPKHQINEEFATLCKGTFISKQGYKTEFYQEGGERQALAIEREGFLSRAHRLTVYIERGFSVAGLGNLDKKIASRYIDVHFAKQGQKGYVYIGKPEGLYGGGKRKLDREEEKCVRQVKQNRVAVEEATFNSLPEEVLCHVLNCLSNEELIKHEYNLVNKKFSHIVHYILFNRVRDAIRKDDIRKIRKLLYLG